MVVSLGQAIMLSLLDKSLLTNDRLWKFGTAQLLRLERITSNHYPLSFKYGTISWCLILLNFWNSWLVFWPHITKRIDHKLHNWKYANISEGGRQILIQATLYLPIYCLSLFHLPTKVAVFLGKDSSLIFWEDSQLDGGMHNVNWKTTQLPQLTGRLAISNREHRNEALLEKWIWRFMRKMLSGSSLLWLNTIHRVLNVFSHLPIWGVFQSLLGGMRYISLTIAFVSTCIQVKVGKSPYSFLAWFMGN